MHAAARTQRPSAPLVSGAGEALCVRVRWGNHRVATHVLDAGLADDAVTLGSGADADVVLPRPGRARFACAGDTFVFAFTDGLAGEVLRNGETPLTLDECISRGLAEESGDGWAMRLGHADAVRLDAGSLTVDAFHIRRPRRALGRLDDVLDYRYLNVLLLCFLAGAVLLAQVSFAPLEAWDDGPSSADVTRLRHILVKPPPEPKKMAAANAASPDAPKKGTPTKDGTPKRKASPPRVGGGGGPDARALVGQAFAGLGAQGVFGGGGLGKELASAMGTMVGASDGLGGLTLRGSGAGGPGGELVGIGGIARPGKKVGEGVGALCPPGKTCKADMTPTIEPGPAVVCGGGPCLDKELIRRIIRSHLGQVRYCYEAQLNANPSLEGKVAITFHVVASGVVDDARVASTTANNTGLESCLVSRVRTWRFPVDARAGSYVVTYPFIFKTAGR